MNLYNKTNNVRSIHDKLRNFMILNGSLIHLDMKRLCLQSIDNNYILSKIDKQMSKKDKKDKKNKNNNNFRTPQNISDNNDHSSLVSEKELLSYKILYQFIDQYGQEGEWIEFDVSLYLKEKNYLTATSLIDYLFNNSLNIDETNIKIYQDEKNYILLDYQDSKSIINFHNNSIKLQLRQVEYSFYQRLMMLKNENKELKDKIQQMQIEKQNDLKIKQTSSKQEEEDEGMIDLGILFSDPLIEMKRIATSYQESVSYQKEIQELKKDLQSISKKVKIKISHLSIENLQKICLQNKPTILHIICHGQIDSQGKYLHFENSDHSLLKVIPDDLRKILSSLGDNKPKVNYQLQMHSLKYFKQIHFFLHLYLLWRNGSIKNMQYLVFVNACNSAIVSDVFREAGVPFVVSVDQNHPILDQVALNFSKQFYRNILQNGISIQEVFKNAQDITDKVIQGNKSYPCCCLHKHKKDCKWFNGKDQSPNHLDHILDCNCSQKQLQIHHHSCIEAQNLMKKCQPHMLNDNQNNHEDIFTCCCYTYQELEQENLFYHLETKKYKLEYDQSNNFFNQPLFKNKNAGTLIDLSEFSIEKIEPTIFVRKNETYNVLKKLQDPNYKCISIVGKKGVGKSLFVNKLIEYAQQRGLYKETMCFKFDMRDIHDHKQFFPFIKKNSKQELIESMENQNALIFLKDCDKIFVNDGNNFISLLQELLRNTQKLKIIMTISKDFHSPFDTFELKDYYRYDTKIYLNYLLLKSGLSVDERIQLIDQFLNNHNIQKTSQNIQMCAKQKNLNGLGDENFQNWYNELAKNPKLIKLTCIVSFFKQGLTNRDFKLLQSAGFIESDWVYQLKKIILIIEQYTTRVKPRFFNDLKDMIKDQNNKNINIQRDRIAFINLRLREFLVEQSLKNFDNTIISLQLFSAILDRMEYQLDWKQLKLIDFSIHSPIFEVFKDVVPQIQNPLLKIQDQYKKKLEKKGKHFMIDTSYYFGFLLDKIDLINENMPSEQIEQIVMHVLNVYFKLISMMKLIKNTNYYLKSICYWGQRFFRRYLELIPEKLLKKENLIKKADIFLDLILLDIEINEKNYVSQVQQHFENINFIIQKSQGMDFAKVVESLLYQSQAYLLLSINQKDLIINPFQQDETGQIQLKNQKDKKLILDTIEKSNQCISKDSLSLSEDFVSQNLIREIESKNQLFKIEYRILFDPLSLTVEDLSTISRIQKNYDQKIYNDYLIILETIVNHIQFQIYKNQIQMGKTDSFNSLNSHIEKQLSQLKDEKVIFFIHI